VSTPQPPARDSHAAEPAEAAIPPPPPLGAGTPFPAPPPVQRVPPPPPGLIPPPVSPRTAAPSQPWISLDRPPAPPPPLTVEGPPPPSLVATENPDELDRTVVVDRRPVVPWHLVVEGGPALRLVGSRVVLGRRPAGAGGDAQELAIPDFTRTLSKVHARLELAAGVWTITDLHATNGVIVIEADGTEQLLDPGASAPLHGRFVLGKVAMRVTSDPADVKP
jgi:hypothetical protein